MNDLKYLNGKHLELLQTAIGPVGHLDRLLLLRLLRLLLSILLRLLPEGLDQDLLTVAGLDDLVTAGGTLQHLET